MPGTKKEVKTKQTKSTKEAKEKKTKKLLKKEIVKVLPSVELSPQKTVEPTKPDQASKPPKKIQVIWTSGRRKTAVARIKLAVGKGSFIVNDKEASFYFPGVLNQELLFSPFRTAGRNEKGFDISIKTLGGGKNAQLEATVLGLAKALYQLEPELKAALKKRGLLTRDSRMKERKKYGLRRARRAPQFSKR